MKIQLATNERTPRDCRITAGAHKGACGIVLGAIASNVQSRSLESTRIQLANGLILETADYTRGEFGAMPFEQFGELLDTKYRKPTYKAPIFPQESQEFSTIVAKIRADIGEYIPLKAHECTYRVKSTIPNIVHAGRAPYIRGFTLIIDDGKIQSSVYCDIKTLVITANGAQHTLREFGREYRHSTFCRFAFFAIMKVLRKMENAGKIKIGTNYKR